jgi:hypothetical protein
MTTSTVGAPDNTRAESCKAAINDTNDNLTNLCDLMEIPPLIFLQFLNA